MVKLSAATGACVWVGRHVTGQAKIDAIYGGEERFSGHVTKLQLLRNEYGASLMAHWYRIRLSLQEMWVQPWSGKIAHALGQLSPGATTVEPVLQS